MTVDFDEGGRHIDSLELYYEHPRSKKWTKGGIFGFREKVWAHQGCLELLKDIPLVIYCRWSHTKFAVLYVEALKKFGYQSVTLRPIIPDNFQGVFTPPKEGA